MLFYIGLFTLVIAVSLDGLGVGMSYGMQKTRVPIIAILIIILLSGVTVLVTMTVGNVLEQFITPKWSKLIGGFILISLGLLTLINNLRTKEEHDQSIENSTTIANLKTVFSSPVRADLDHSGNISAKESLLLGLALALDAFGAGIAASLFNYSAFLTSSLIAIMSGAFLFIGTKIGMLLSKQQNSHIIAYLPPLLLIGIGILKLL